VGRIKLSLRNQSKRTICDTEKGKIGDHKSREGEEEALKILNIADVTSATRVSGTMVPMSKHVLNCTET